MLLEHDAAEKCEPMTANFRRCPFRVSRRGLLGAALVLAVALQMSAPTDGPLSVIRGADRDPPKQGFALIYSGPSSGDDCPEAVAAVAREAGLSVRFVDSPDKIPDQLKGAAVLVIGGTTGDLADFRKSFPAKTVDAIRRYVRGGGRYWGICGGAYLAAEEFEGADGPVEALKLIPASAQDHSDNFDARLETVVWRGKKRVLYLQGSPKFVLSEGKTAIEVIAHFDDDSVAALQCAYGRGKVAVSGPHPEAPKSWLEYDDLDSADWTPTRPLAVTMLKDLLSDGPIRRKSD
jgi:glutamine amidotransferase-like uncharacterized protein